MKINKVHCLFEQTGTFKKAFKKLGYSAEDYDIQDNFGETDHKVDLFHEINEAYAGHPSLFDTINKDDLIVAFFPCTRFECQATLSFRGCGSQMKKWSDETKLDYSMKLHEELHELYMLLSKLCQICLRGGYRIVIENPYTQPHYLTMYFPLKPAVIIKDRHKEGDYYKKPTQFFFINCMPEENFVFEPITFVAKQTHVKAAHFESEGTRTEKRSKMHPQFAERFIKIYILDAEGGIWK